MTIAMRLFFSSAGFTGTLAIVYWYVAREPAGTMLLGWMTVALLVVAFYLATLRRSAALFSDEPNARPSDANGERLGTFTLHSPIPFWIGLATMLVVMGLVVSGAAVGLAIVVLLFLGALMIVRSR